MDNIADPRSNILLSMIQDAIKAKSDFCEIGKEINQYAYSKDHNFQYDNMVGTDPNIYWKAKVAKTAEYMEVIGPALYQNNPDRRVNPKPWSQPIQRQRAMVMQDYLNYLPAECGLASHSRKAINDALVWGAGVLWTGYNPKKKCIQSVHDSIDNLLLDPTASSMEELQWCARKRCKPLWQVIGRYPKATNQLANYKGADYSGSTGKVTYYEVYTIAGLHNFNGGSAVDRNEEGIPYKSEEPKKYIITDDGKVLDETEWEIPFHLDDKWPFSFLGFRFKPGCIWPASPLEMGLPFQKAINFAYTFFMEKVRVASKDVIAFAKILGDSLSVADRKRIQHGFGTQLVEMEVAGDGQTKLADLIQQWRFDAGLTDFQNIVAILERQFERMTGLTEFIAVGTTENQFRSAAEANLKDKNARTRFEDMRMQVESWQSEIARHEAQAARYLLEPQDIQPILGPEAAQVWGQIMPPTAQIEQQLMQEFQAQGVPPEAAAPMIQQQLEAMTANGVVYEDWLLEADYSIEAGSTRRQDIQQQIDASNEFMRQALPVLMGPAQMSPPVMAAAMQSLVAWAKINGMPVEMQDALQQSVVAVSQPPPMPMAPPAGPSPTPDGPPQQ
jgi:hypothetical protein